MALSTPERAPGRPPRRDPRRHPRRLDPGVALAAGFGGCVALTALLAALGGSRAPGADFLAYAVLTALLAWLAGPAAGLGVAALAWLFWAGFLLGRHGTVVPSLGAAEHLLALAGIALAAVAAARCVRLASAALSRRADPPADAIPAPRAANPG